MLLQALSLHAQSTAMEWMASPFASPHEALWFHRTFLTHQRPLTTHISITTACNIKLYFNEIPLTPNISTNNQLQEAGAIYTFQFDVSNYTRADSNTVAILCAPAPPNQLQTLAVDVYGLHRNGLPFAHRDADNWLCRPSGITITANRECHDCYAQPDDGYTQHIATACWLPPAIPHTALNHRVISHYPHEPLHYHIQVEHPCSVHTLKQGIAYDFGEGFYGYIRLTLRDATPGEHITVNGASFTCHGTTDEQASTLFVPRYYRWVVITGEENFTPDQIQQIEGLRITPSFHHIFY